MVFKINAVTITYVITMMLWWYNSSLNSLILSLHAAYCLAYDRNTHSRDIHATMTDKCCQARSRKGAHSRAT